MEVWKDIKGYEGLYKISNLGNVISLHKSIPKEIKPQLNNSGYLIVGLNKNKKRTTTTIHRLIAKAFIDNPKNKPEVNHINEIKTDNRVENLEWSTKIYNRNFGNRNNLISKSNKGNPRKYLRKPVIQSTKNGEFVKKWDFMAQIETELGFKTSNISNCCNGNANTAYGYLWKYQ